MSQDLVSVIITTYHNEDLLPRAIESVLHQTYPSIELIVVDDNPPKSGSRKATEKVMLAYPQVVYIKHPENRNGSAARNTGIGAANGKYIAFLDNDDIYLENHIASCVEALETHKQCDAVLCSVVKICEGLCWDIIPAIQGHVVKEILFSERSLGTGSNLFVTAKAVKAINGFDESFRRHQDIEFALRLFSLFDSISLEEVQIIKEMGGFSNTPAFESYRETKKHLWETFSELLKGLTAEECNRYFSGQYSALLYSACQSGNQSYIRWTIKRLLHHRKLNKKEKIMVFLTKRNLFDKYEWIKLVIKKYRNRKNLHIMLSQMNDHDRKTLLKSLGKD